MSSLELNAQLADLALANPPQTPDMESPNAMAIDGDDTHIVQLNGTSDTGAVTEIPPPSLSDSQTLDVPLADDCRSLRSPPSRWRRSMELHTILINAVGQMML